MDYKKLLDSLPQAKASYGDATTSKPVSVGTWGVVDPKQKFEAETTNFQAGLYKDSATGAYRVGFAGSNDTQDWTRTNVNLAQGLWDASATDSIRFMAAALKEVKADFLAKGEADTSLPRLLQHIDTTGHSQGGALSELNSAFWGNRATNIDGPGIGGLLDKPEFAALKAEMQKEFPELSSKPYTANDGGMQIFAFTKIGLTGQHVGATVQATPDAAFVDALTDIPAPTWPLMSAQGALFGAQTAFGHRLDSIEAQAKAGAGIADPANSSLTSIDALGNYQPAGNAIETDASSTHTETNAASQAQRNQRSQDNFARNEISYQNSIAPNGQPFGIIQKVNANATETWDKSASGVITKTTDIANGVSITRILQVTDAKGTVTDEKVYVKPNPTYDPGSKEDFHLVGTFDPASGTRRC